MKTSLKTAGHALAICLLYAFCSISYRGGFMEMGRGAGLRADWIIPGGVSDTAMLLSVAIVYATIAAWLWHLAVSAKTAVTGGRLRPNLDLVAGAAIPLAVALAVRFLLTYRGNSEIRLFFFSPYLNGFNEDKHSVLYPWFKYIVYLFSSNNVPGLINFNTLIGSLAVVPFYLFILRRGGRRSDAFWGALFLALHPPLARITATDGHFPMFLFFWSAGLAELSRQQACARSSFMGLVFLGISTVMRIEGLLYLAAALLLLGPGLIRRLRPSWMAALAGIGVVALLVAVQYWKLFYMWGSDEKNSVIGFLFNRRDLVDTAGTVLELAVEYIKNGQHAGVVYAGSFMAGLAAIALNRKRRWGANALAAWVIVLLFHRNNTGFCPMFLHRNVPFSAVQCIVCGMGAGWVLSLLPSKKLRLAATAAAAGIIIAAVPAAGRYILSHKFAYNHEFELLLHFKERAAQAGVPCALIRHETSGDKGISNPQEMLEKIRVVSCDGTESCLKEAQKYQCLYYLRSAWCFYTPEIDQTKTSLPPVPNRRCSDIEERLDMVPARETRVDIAETYGSYWDTSPSGMIGLYRVNAVKPPR